MARIVLGVIAGFMAWMLAWFGGEQLLTAIGPDWFGAPQRAFEAALMNGGQLTVSPIHLLAHIGLALIVTTLAGFLAAAVARENKRAPFAVGVLLLPMGIMKASMSWTRVPMWYHLMFTGLLLPMAIVGGKLKAAAK